MQTQRQQFIKSTRRKNSPKFKLQTGISNQCQHKIQLTQNEESIKRQEEYRQKQAQYHQKLEPTYQNLQVKNIPKNTNIVADLKYQLSFLKDQIAKISNQKPNKKQNQINKSNRIGEYYFPSSKTPIQNQSKMVSSIHNGNSQQKIQALKFKKLKNLQKRIKSAKSGQKLTERQKQISISPVYIKENHTNQNSNFEQQFKKVKNAINNKYQNHFKQLTKEYALASENQNAYDKDSQMKINEKIIDQQQSTREQQINKSAKAAYELKSMKMKKTIKDSSIQIQNLKIKLQQQQKLNNQQKENQRQQLTLIEVLQKQLSLNKMKIMTLENAEKQLLAKLDQATSNCKCKQLQKTLRQKQQEISSLQQKIQKQQSLFYNKQLQTLKLQRTIINLQKEKCNNLKTQKSKSKEKEKEKDKDKEKDQKENKEKQDMLSSNLTSKNDRSNNNKSQINGQLKQIIKIQQKSLINLQSDLRYLQHELSMVAGIKGFCKKQTKLIEQLNYKICILQGQKLNQKYLQLLT